LAWLPWQNIATNALKEVVDLTEFKEVSSWLERLKSRPALKKVLDELSPAGH
jgi:glutathione S-transferase